MQSPTAQKSAQGKGIGWLTVTARSTKPSDWAACGRQNPEPGTQSQAQKHTQREGSHLAQSGRTTSNTSGGTRICGEGKASEETSGTSRKDSPEEAPQTSHQSPFLQLGIPVSG